MPSKQIRQSRREDKAEGPFPSLAVARRLRRIPDPLNVEQVITPEDWAKRPGVPGLEKSEDRDFCNRVIAYYRINKGVEKKPPREIRKELDRRAQKLKSWITQLSELNDRAEFFEARSRICPGASTAEREKQARDQVRLLREALEKIARDLEKAADAIPRGTTRIREQKSEVLYYLMYNLNYYLFTQTGKGVRRSTSARNKTIQFAIWLFRIADPDLVPQRIETAAKKALRKEMNDEEYLTFLHESSKSLFPHWRFVHPEWA